LRTNKKTGKKRTKTHTLKARYIKRAMCKICTLQIPKARICTTGAFPYKLMFYPLSKTFWKKPDSIKQHHITQKACYCRTLQAYATLYNTTNHACVGIGKGEVSGSSPVGSSTRMSTPDIIKGFHTEETGIHDFYTKKHKQHRLNLAETAGEPLFSSCRF